MIKFYRKIRQQLLTENKFSKYLLYAIGEIVLVVIGILIALYLNKKNELAQSEIKVETILLEVLEELSTNIKQADFGIKSSFESEHYFKLVRQNALTQEYVSNNLDELIQLTTFYNYATFTQNGYDNLTSNLNIVPNEYKTILKKLNTLYGGTTRFVYKYNDLIEEMANNTISKRADNYEWFSSPDNPDLRKDMNDFILNDYKFKNEVEHFYRVSQIHNHFLLSYITESIKAYNDVATLLGVPTLNIYSNSKIEAAKLLVGEWETTTVPDYGDYTFKIKNDLLYSFPSSDSTNITQEYIISTKKSNSKIIINTLNGVLFSTYILEGDTINVSDSDDKFKLVRINNN